MCLTALLLPSAASALNIRGVEVGIQPRLEAGVLQYEYQQDAITGTLLTSFETIGSTFLQEKFRFKDTLPFAGAGLTVFADRFFLDISGLTTISEGEDGDTITFSQFQEFPTTDLFSTGSLGAQPAVNADFERDEYAISLGYGVTEQLAVFAGYKWARTDFETQGRGPTSAVFTIGGIPQFDRVTVEGFVEQEADFDFEYDGPFVGINYGLEVNAGFLEGTLSFNFAAAFLDGESKVKAQSSVFAFAGLEDTPLDEAQVAVESEGETVGLTFGVGWRGFTPIENLTYAVNISGYKYEFDADNQGGALENPDVDESALAFKVGLGYAF
jgi:hypothetical protein